jgi:hypothetical protein
MRFSVFNGRLLALGSKYFGRQFLPLLAIEYQYLGKKGKKVLYLVLLSF